MQETLLGSRLLFICLYVSIAICAAGILFRAGRWFFINTGPAAGKAGVSSRIAAVIKGFFATLISVRFFLFFKLLVLDVLLQTRILKTDVSRWLMHLDRKSVV